MGRPTRKQFPLRISKELFDAYDAWAADEFRSINAQIEAVLMDAAKRAGRLGPRPPSRTRNGHRAGGDRD